MLRLVIGLTCAVAAASAQFVDPAQAKILKEQRFNAGDGRAGAAFATEDGVIFKEETDLDGNRVGQYSYVGDDGETYTVRYSAGKDGFRILDGAHIPSGGQGAAAFVADPDAELNEAPIPAPQPAPLPARRPAPRPLAARPPPPPQPEPVFEEAPVDPNFNPFINPHDPTHRDFRFNKNAAAHNPNSPLAQQASLVPPCADCAGVNPFINPFDASHQPSAGVLAGHLAGHLAGAAPRRAPRPAPRQRPQTVVPPPAPLPQLPQPSAAVPPRTLRPTVRPNNFFPPGQLTLNRFETGFNFDFES